VGEEATASKGDLKEQEARRWAEVEGDEPPQDAPETLDLMDFPLEWPEQLSPKFGGCESTILKWIQELVSPDDGVVKVVQWISMYHLLLDFQRSTGVVGDKRNADTKQWQVITSWEAMQSYCFCEVTTDFSALLRGVLSQVSCRSSGILYLSDHLEGFFGGGFVVQDFGCLHSAFNPLTIG